MRQVSTEKLSWSASNYDDDLMELVLEGDEVPIETLKSVIRNATLSGRNPVLCGSAFKNKGVHLLLDAVIDYLPSPTDVPAIEGLRVKSKAVTDEVVTRSASDEEPFAALAFKITTDPYVGQLVYLRVYSGQSKRVPKFGMPQKVGENAWVGFFECTQISVRISKSAMQVMSSLLSVLKESPQGTLYAQKTGNPARAYRIPRAGDSDCYRAEDEGR